MSTQALAASISSLSLLLVQTQAARWKAATPDQLTGAHLYLDIAYVRLPLSCNWECYITSLTIVYSIVYGDAYQRKHPSSASLAFVPRIHRGPVNSPHKWPLTLKMFLFHDVIQREISLWSPNPVTNEVPLSRCLCDPESSGTIGTLLAHADSTGTIKRVCWHKPPKMTSTGDVPSVKQPK